VLYVEGELGRSRIRANQHDLFICGDSVAKLKPDVRVVEADIRQAHGRIANTRLDFLNRDADLRVAIYAIWFESRIFDRGRQHVFVAVIEHAVVKRLHNETAAHWYAR
jgi:hypothetical protein